MSLGRHSVRKKKIFLELFLILELTTDSESESTIVTSSSIFLPTIGFFFLIVKSFIFIGLISCECRCMYVRACVLFKCDEGSGTLVAGRVCTFLYNN